MTIYINVNTDDGGQAIGKFLMFPVYSIIFSLT